MIHLKITTDTGVKTLTFANDTKGERALYKVITEAKNAHLKHPYFVGLSKFVAIKADFEACNGSYTKKRSVLADKWYKIEAERVAYLRRVGLENSKPPILKIELINC